MIYEEFDNIFVKVANDISPKMNNHLKNEYDLLSMLYLLTLKSTYLLLK